MVNSRGNKLKWTFSLAGSGWKHPISCKKETKRKKMYKWMRGNCCLVIGFFGPFLKGTEPLQKPPAVWIFSGIAHYRYRHTIRHSFHMGRVRVLQTALPVSPSSETSAIFMGKTAGLSYSRFFLKTMHFFYNHAILKRLFSRPQKKSLASTQKQNI